MLTVHGGDEEMQSWGATDGLTGRGGDMGLEARGEARDSTSCRAGGREALDRIEELAAGAEPRSWTTPVKQTDPGDWMGGERSPEETGESK